MSEEKDDLDGFSLLPVRIRKEARRLLKWGKTRSGVSMTAPLVMEVEKRCEEILKKYGPPPADFK